MKGSTLVQAADQQIKPSYKYNNSTNDMSKVASCY